VGTHIVTIPNEEYNTWNWEELHSAKYSFSPHFRLKLADNQSFLADEILRVLPKRRLVAFGTWQEKPVVAKLFFDPKNAQRHMEKDAAGARSLRENKIPAPALLHRSMSEDGRVCVLLFERIYHATSLGEAWRNRESIKDVMPLLRGTVVEIATQHVLGVLQHDLHLNNFLITRKTIYTLDGGQIETFPPLLSKKQSMKSLALFLAQLGVGVEACQEKLFLHYAKARGWLLKKNDIASIFFYIKTWNEKRWMRFQRKLFRNCTDFSFFKDWHTVGAYDRHYAFPEFTEFLIQPEMAFDHPSMKVLKAGRSSTVVKVTLDNKEFVIKRYNMKSIWHRLRRCFRPTRAAHSWRLAHKLSLFGVATAKPVAFIEKRFLGLRGKSYYVSEYVSSTNVSDYINNNLGNLDKIDTIVLRTAAMLKNLAKLAITHGDLKATNILIDKREQPVLIDLDGAVENGSIVKMRLRWRKEIERFLKNFESLPPVMEKFKSALS
jgi:tRNA A-37 threonylcarbamoyl transferase component Bud32